MEGVETSYPQFNIPPTACETRLRAWTLCVLNRAPLYELLASENGIN
jgi:hypothetical protein